MVWLVVNVAGDVGVYSMVCIRTRITSDGVCRMMSARIKTVRDVGVCGMP